MLILPHLILAPHIIIRLYKGTLPHKPIQFAFAESSRKRLHWAASSLREQKTASWHCGFTLKNYRTPNRQTGRPRTRSCGIRRQSEIHLWKVHKLRSALSGIYISFWLLSSEAFFPSLSIVLAGDWTRISTKGCAKIDLEALVYLLKDLSHVITTEFFTLFQINNQ